MDANRERWHGKHGGYVIAPKVNAFLAEIADVCRRHGFNIEHEDPHGVFVIEALPEGEDPDGILCAHLGNSIPLPEPQS